MHLEISANGLPGTATTSSGPAAEAPRAARAPAPQPKAERTWTLPGLCWNTRVTTSFGALPVQVLRKFDPLRLADGSVQRIAWVDKIQLDEDFLHAYPDAQPVLIRAGSLDQGLPAQDILVSPHQKLNVRGPNFESELRAARDLLGRPGVLRQPQTVLTYYLFHCGQPARVSVEGLAVFTAP